MGSIIRILYTLGIHAGNLYIWVSSFFSQKMAILWRGRRRTLALAESGLAEYRHCIWMHCASLGEYEQGRPLLEALKKSRPEQKIVLSFFSPSGYEIRHKDAAADLVIYLPSDLPYSAWILSQALQPALCIWVKYEFWWNLLQTLVQQKIPVYLVAGIFRKTDYFFQWWAKPFLSILNQFDGIFVQDETSAAILRNKNISVVRISGDPRVDRVVQMRSMATPPETFKGWAAGRHAIVYGSVWPTDMHIVSGMIQALPHFCHIVVPHDVSPASTRRIAAALETDAIVYSSAQWSLNGVMVVDTIGLLSSLYSLASYAYIGGGFGRAIHNILEPAVFGIPVYMGPRHKKFAEATSLKNTGIALSVRTSSDMLESVCHMEEDAALKEEVRRAAAKWFQQQQGATERILEVIVK